MKISWFKSHTFLALALQLVFSMFVGQVRAEEFPISPEWKAHFTDTPIIEICVFERTLYSGNGETNLYQFRYQTNGFMVRQIRTLDDIYSNQIPRINLYAGHFESNYWAIDAGNVLKLFPNFEGQLGSPQNGDVALLSFAERYMFSALYYGINNLDPKTVQWPEELKFTALSVLGQRCVGQIIESSRGLPTVLRWHMEQSPQLEFLLEYNYNNSVGLSYYPSEIRLFSRVGGNKTLNAVHKVLIMRTSNTPLGVEAFRATNYAGTRAVTLVFTNNDIYTPMADGKLTKVLPVSALPIERTSAKTASIVRLVFAGIFAISLITAYLVWRTTTTTNKRNNK